MFAEIVKERTVRVSSCTCPELAHDPCEDKIGLNLIRSSIALFTLITKGRRPLSGLRSKREWPKFAGQMTDLFAAANLAKDAPHPLADRLRPQSLADVAGQDHLLGPQGALR